MPTATSQQTSVAFASQPIGYLTGWRLVAATAQFEDTTNITSQVIGTGVNARVVRQYDCTSVEPGSIDVTLFGVPPFVDLDIGQQGALTVTFADESEFSVDAYLETFDVSAAVGEFLVGTARFRFSGKVQE